MLVTFFEIKIINQGNSDDIIVNLSNVEGCLRKIKRVAYINLCPWPPNMLTLLPANTRRRQLPPSQSPAARKSELFYFPIRVPARLCPFSVQWICKWPPSSGLLPPLLPLSAHSICSATPALPGPVVPRRPSPSVPISACLAVFWRWSFLVLNGCGCGCGRFSVWGWKVDFCWIVVLDWEISISKALCLVI